MDSKEELDRRKLELEIAELHKPLWLRPAYLGVALPIVLSILAFLSALLSGYFDRERAALRVEIKQLVENRDSLKRERDDLAGAVQQYEDYFEQRRLERAHPAASRPP